MVQIDEGRTVRAAIGAELLAARRARDTIRVRVQRALLAAIDNAEAVAADQTYDVSLPGLGSTEVARHRLDEAAVRRLFDRERQEREDAAASYRERHQREVADVLDAEVAVIVDYLDRLPRLAAATNG